jgi:probable F420-dependent oxidoreductase
MKIGILGLGFGPTATGPLIRAGAQAAERAGFSICWFGEHTVLFEGEAEKHYPDRQSTRKSRSMIIDPRTAIPDSVVAMTWAAAVTKRIEIGSHIIILPQHQPVVLAKALSSLDNFSGGRLVAAFGSGWSLQEYQATGANWSHRGKRMDEYADVLRALWRKSPASFSGETVNFEEAYLHPRPARDIPIIFGGESEAVLRRVASRGDGWAPVHLDLQNAAETIKKLRILTKECGRDPDKLHIIKSLTIRDNLDDFARFRDAGVTEFKLNCYGDLPADEKAIAATIEQWGETLVKHVAAL